MQGLPCTTSYGVAATVSLVGLMKTPVCATSSANGRFLNFGPVIIDTQTNLMWEKKDQAGGLNDADDNYNWCAATGTSDGRCVGNQTSWIGQINTAAFSGFSDWRVPTRAELLTIADYTIPGCGSVACINPIFGPTPMQYYWSSTVTIAGFAWLRDFYSNAEFNATAETNSNHYHVRAVRTWQ
jgi:hypothetical protein